jgi:hypothetical protein
MATPSVAQEPAPVTDTELRAAYCLGVATYQFETLTGEINGYQFQLKAGRGTPETKDFLFLRQTTRKSVTERRDRLRDYLKAKFLSGRNIKVIEAALQRGPADSKQCIVDGDDPFDKSCRKRCGPMIKADDYGRCDVMCPPSGACVRVGRCLENFLPF